MKTAACLRNTKYVNTPMTSIYCAVTTLQPYQCCDISCFCTDMSVEPFSRYGLMTETTVLEKHPHMWQTPLYQFPQKQYFVSFYALPTGCEDINKATRWRLYQSLADWQ